MLMSMRAGGQSHSKPFQIDVMGAKILTTDSLAAGIFLLCAVKKVCDGGVSEGIFNGAKLLCHFSHDPQTKQISEFHAEEGMQPL